ANHGPCDGVLHGLRAVRQAFGLDQVDARPHARRTGDLDVPTVRVVPAFQRRVDDPQHLDREERLAVLHPVPAPAEVDDATLLDAPDRQLDVAVRDAELVIRTHLVELHLQCTFDVTHDLAEDMAEHALDAGHLAERLRLPPDPHQAEDEARGSYRRALVDLGGPDTIDFRADAGEGHSHALGDRARIDAGAEERGIAFPARLLEPARILLSV